MSGDPHSKRLHGRRPELQSPTHPKLCEAKVPVIPAALIRFRQPLHVLRRERACVGVTWHAKDHGRALGVLYGVYIGIMEKNMVTTIIILWGLYIGFILGFYAASVKERIAQSGSEIPCAGAIWR